MDLNAALANVLDRCLGVRVHERILILADSDSDHVVVDMLCRGIDDRGATASVLALERFDIPGSEVAPDVARTMQENDAVIELTSTFIGSNQARRDANTKGVRYLAMPGITLQTLRADGPLGVNFDELRQSAEEIGELWTRASEFRLTNPAGGGSNMPSAQRRMSSCSKASAPTSSHTRKAGDELTAPPKG